MSNDFISRDAVMDYLREQQANVIIEKNKNGFVSADVCDGMSSAIGAFMNFIVQLPTAYDVDKVVERLEEKILNTSDTQIGISARMAFGKSIEIVKSGGIE